MQDRSFSPPRTQARRTWRQHAALRLVRGVAVVYCVMFAPALLQRIETMPLDIVTVPPLSVSREVAFQVNSPPPLSPRAAKASTIMTAPSAKLVVATDRRIVIVATCWTKACPLTQAVVATF